MSPDEVNDLVNRASKAGAQEVVAKLEADRVINSKAYISVDTPSTAIWIVGAFISLVAGYYALRIAPVETRLKAQESFSTKLERKMDAGFQHLADLIREEKK